MDWGLLSVAMGGLTQRVVGLAVIGVVAATGFAGCAVGSDDDDAASELSQQKKLDEARKQGERDQQLKELQKKLDKMEKKGASTTPAAPSGGGAAPSVPSAKSGPTNCGDGLTAGSNTSCPFARSVRDEYPGSANTFQVYSSVTGQNYSMACTTASPHVCRGGNNATVFFP